MPNTQYKEYLQKIANPDEIDKLAKLEFLNDDGTIAFVIDNNSQRNSIGYSAGSRAFLQDGTLR